MKTKYYLLSLTDGKTYEQKEVSNLNHNRTVVLRK